MQGIQVIQKEMIKRSFYKHQKRLGSIKSTDTSFQFYSTAKPKPQDRKKILLNKQREEEIERHNELLYKKIDNIKKRQKSLLSQDKDNNLKQVQNKTKNFNNNHRYLEKLQDMNPICMNIDNGDNTIKFTIPAPQISKPKISSFKINNYRKLNSSQSVAKNDHSNSNSFDIFTTDEKNHKNKQFFQKTPLNIGQKYKENPQFLNDRIVLYKKTIIYAPMTSCLIQVSLIQKRLLFMGYIMGLENHTAKLYLDQARSQNILNAFKNDMQGLGSKVGLNSNRQIRIQQLIDISNIHKNPNLIVNVQAKKVVSKQDKIKVQQDFIKRNHYNKEISSLTKTQNLRKDFLQNKQIKTNQNNRNIVINRQKANKTSHYARYQQKYSSESNIGEKQKQKSITNIRKLNSSNHEQQLEKSITFKKKSQNNSKFQAKDKDEENEYYKESFVNEEVGTKKQSMYQQVGTKKQQSMYEEVYQENDFENVSKIKQNKEEQNQEYCQQMNQQQNIEKSQQKYEQQYQDQQIKDQNQYEEQFQVESPKKMKESKK